jgi:RNA polymerase sigma factor (sigma-70 family)
MYGPLIYSYPVRVYGLPEDEAGDFYQYAFAKDRIFRRMSKFQGIHPRQFKMYLTAFVLKHLLLEWRRQRDPTVTVPLDEGIADPHTGPEATLAASEAAETMTSIFSQLDTETALVLKLLALGTVDLGDTDILSLARMTSRSFRDMVHVLETVVTKLTPKADRAQIQWDSLHKVSSWIYMYQRQIASLKEEIYISSQNGDAHTVHILTQELAELERKLAWRLQQQTKLQQALQKLSIRPSYRDIADILQVSLGVASTKIIRAREALRQQLLGAEA